MQTESIIELVLAAAPLIVFFVLVLAAKRPVFQSAFISFLVTAGIGFSVWKMETGRVAAAAGKGLFLATEIIFIVFSSLLVIEILKAKGLTGYLKSLFEWISKDERVHVLLIGWALIYFLESVSGFGTPAMLALPVFLALGFSPLTAVIVSLIGNSVPSIFGAIGMPVIFGIGSVLESSGKQGLMESLPTAIAGLNIIGNTLAPLLMIYTFCAMEKKPFKHFKEFIPFTLATSFIASAASILTAAFMGPELPSVAAGTATIASVSFMARKKILLPKTESSENLGPTPSLRYHKKSILQAVTPYAILLSLLVVSRVPFFPVRDFLVSFKTIRIAQIFSYPVGYSFYPLHSAGVLILIAAAISAAILKLSPSEIGGSLASAGKKIWKPYLALLFIISMVQIFVYSGENLSGLVSMPIMLAGAASRLFGTVWPLIAPFVGALGAFAAGSATVSNLIFTGFQYETALASGFSPVLILSLQALGAAAGNMIALHNIIVLLAVADIDKKEDLIVKKNLAPLLTILLALGSIGFLLSFTDLFGS